MDSSRIAVLAIMLLVSGTVAQAGPCTKRISQIEAQIRAQGAQTPGGVEGANAPQSIGARLHRQPTAQSVEAAQSKANADAMAALDRARKADADGKVGECTKALDQAKQLYGIGQ